MIDVKQAVQIARQYIRDLYAEDEIPNLLLEETQITEDNQYWLITIGFDAKDAEEIAKKVASNVENADVRRTIHFLGRQLYRNFKVIKIKAGDGTVEPMMNCL